MIMYLNSVINKIIYLPLCFGLNGYDILFPLYMKNYQQLHNTCPLKHMSSVAPEENFISYGTNTINNTNTQRRYSMNYNTSSW